MFGIALHVHPCPIDLRLKDALPFIPHLGRRESSDAMGCGQSGASSAKENKSSGGQAHDKQQAKEENKQYQAREWEHWKLLGMMFQSSDVTCCFVAMQ